MIDCVFIVNHRLRQHDVAWFDIWEQDADRGDHTIVFIEVFEVGPAFGDGMSVTPHNESQLMVSHLRRGRLRCSR